MLHPLGSWLGRVLPTPSAGAQGVSLVLAVTDLLVPSKLGREAKLEIVGNPITAPPGSFGANVDKRRAPSCPPRWGAVPLKPLGRLGRSPSLRGRHRIEVLALPQNVVDESQGEGEDKRQAVQ